VLQELLTPFGINYKIVKDRIVLYKPKSFSYEVIAPAINNELPVNIETADKEIKGQITDDKGASLAGVSIVVKGTGKGVNTDLNGAFTISVPEDKSVLVITYIGYQQQEVDITGKTLCQYRHDGGGWSAERCGGSRLWHAKEDHRYGFGGYCERG
jgi:hypothetical protein